MTYVKIRSFHLVRLMTRGGQLETLCGRMAPRDAETADSFGDERTCEVCYRVAAKRGLGVDG